MPFDIYGRSAIENLGDKYRVAQLGGQGGLAPPQCLPRVKNAIKVDFLDFQKNFPGTPQETSKTGF